MLITGTGSTNLVYTIFLFDLTSLVAISWLGFPWSISICSKLVTEGIFCEDFLLLVLIGYNISRLIFQIMVVRLAGIFP